MTVLQFSKHRDLLNLMKLNFFSFHEEKICDSIAYFDLPFYIAYLDSEYALPCLIGLSKFLGSHISHQSEL